MSVQTKKIKPLTSLYGDTALSDVLIIISWDDMETSFPGHRAILAERSSWLREKILQLPPNRPHIRIQFKGQENEVVETMLRFFYNGTFETNDLHPNYRRSEETICDGLIAMYKIAAKHGVPTLAARVETLFAEHIDGVDTRHYPELIRAYYSEPVPAEKSKIGKTIAGKIDALVEVGVDIHRAVDEYPDIVVDIGALSDSDSES